jgi:hypothetical protein
LALPLCDRELRSQYLKASSIFNQPLKDMITQAQKPIIELPHIEMNLARTEG